LEREKLGGSEQKKYMTDSLPVSQHRVGLTGNLLGCSGETMTPLLGGSGHLYTK